MKGIIKAITKEPKTYEGVTTLGFLLENNSKWFNIEGDDEIFKRAREVFLIKGNNVEFKIVDGFVVDFNVLKVATKEKESKHIVDIKGKKFMTYEGLLEKAHEKGEDKNFSMIITDSWVSEDMKRAWCKIRLTVGAVTFDGFGSSTPENTGAVTDHPVELCHTRAKGRALRDYLNIGQVMAEELKR